MNKVVRKIAEEIYDIFAKQKKYWNKNLHKYEVRLLGLL